VKTQTRRPIRVAHVITRMIVGGAQENTLLTVAGLASLPDFSVDLISGSDHGAEGNMLEIARRTTNVILIPEMQRNINPLADAVALWRLYNLLRRGRYDIVHTHLAKAGILGRIAAKLAGTPIVIHGLHGMVFNDYQPWIINRACWAAQRLVDPLTDHYISVSSVVSEKAIGSGIGKPESHTTIYSGMELDWYVNPNLDGASMRAQWGIPAGALVVGKVARMAPVKGYDLFLDALPRILDVHPDTYFLLVGDGPLKESIRRRTEKMGVSQRVIAPGLLPREKVPEAIAAMDVMAHSALYEGLPRVIVQALAAKVPVVAFDADGTREVVVSDETGFLVRPGDTEGFAAAVNRLLSDGELREKLGREGQRRVDPSFRVETMVADTRRLYENLVQEYASRLPKGLTKRNGA
jgi:glycosyltransferase involved in cell wall biosynthesis